MKFKSALLIFTLLWAQVTRANMSSPIWRGTVTSTAFSSKDIDILSESIHIKIDEEYQTARYIIEYTLHSDVAGRQIPLLFYAQDYKDSFLVWVDDQSVAIQNIPEQYTTFVHSSLSRFSNVINITDPEVGSVLIQWDKNSSYPYYIKDLKYFETDLKKGIHKVRVTYTANAWTDVSDWIKIYSFHYSLTPAKFWKSFGKLKVTVEQAGIVRPISTNIGAPIEQTILAKNTWMFTRLPGEYLEFTYTPTTGKLAQVLIAIKPFGLSIITAVLLFVLHLWLVIRYRKRQLHKKYSYVVIIGSWLIPFLILLSYIYSFMLIDYLIGEDAGGRHGYVFLVVIFYPFLVPLYWTIIWLLDRSQKRKLLHRKNSG